MGYAHREFRIGERPHTPDGAVVVTRGSTWREDHYITLPPVGAVVPTDTIDNVEIHVRRRAGDTEPIIYGTSSPANKVTVSRPSPDLLKVSFKFDPEDTELLEALNAPILTTFPGTEPPEPTPGQGLVAIKVYLSSGEDYEYFRAPLVAQPALVF